MAAPDGLVQAAGRSAGLAGRRLLSSDCTVMGSMGVGGSVTLLLLIGFAVGAGVSCLFFWWRERRRMRIELEYRNRFGDAVRSGLPDVSAMVKAAHTPTISRSAVGALPAGTGGEMAQSATGQLLAKAASTLAQDGPLAMGAASTFKQDSLRHAVSLKEQQHPNQHVNPLATAAGSGSGGVSMMARSSSGNPFAAEVPSFRVRKNEACSLNNTPSSSRTGLPSGAASPEGLSKAGLIGTGVYGIPATDPSSPRITKPSLAGSTAAAATAASPFAWPGLPAHPLPAATGNSEQQHQPGHARSNTVVVTTSVDAGGSSGMAQAAPPAQPTPAVSAAPPAPPSTSTGKQAGRGGSRSSDYLAALDSASTNPFETPALRRQQEEEGGMRDFAGMAAGPATAAAAAAPAASSAAAGSAALGTASPAAPPAGSAAPRPAPAGSAAPRPAPAGSAAPPSAAAAAQKAAEKAELLQQVQSEEYGDDELDTEWVSLLGELDSRLQAVGRPHLTDKERAVAIRSLIVATASASADAALAKAQHDVEAFRRVQANRAANS